MGGLGGWVVPLSTDEMWQEAGEGSQMLALLHGRSAGFPSLEKSRKLFAHTASA